MKPLFLFFPFLLLLQAAVCAQQPESLGADISFFRQQAVVYQQWLTHSGMGNTLRVADMEVRADTQCILFLGFYTTDADSAHAQWKRLGLDYQGLGTGDSLEKALFDRLIFLMEVPPKQGEVRVLNTFDLNVKPCFGRRIHLTSGQLRTAVKSCKSENQELVIRPCDLTRNGRPMSAKTFELAYSQSAVFEKLIPYLTQKYTQTQCDGRYPRIIFHNVVNELHFEVLDLCKEILTDEVNPWWCDLLYELGYLDKDTKNCIKRERIVGHITYEKNGAGAGFVLKTKIDAAYGSGWYDKPRNNGYHDLQNDYPDYLGRYARLLNENMRVYLSKP